MRQELYDNEGELDADAGTTPLDKFCKHVTNSTNSIGQLHNKKPEVYGPYSVMGLGKVKPPDTLRSAIEKAVNLADKEGKKGKCPNASGVCFCTGACQPGYVASQEAFGKIQQVTPPAPVKGQTFVTEHNQEKSVYPGLAGYPPKKTENSFPPNMDASRDKIAQPQDPATYYNGTQTLEDMITEYGREFVRVWAVGNTHKYLVRMGLKDGATIEQDKKKALWYLAVAERLYKEITGGY